MIRILITEDLYKTAQQYGKDPFNKRLKNFIKPKIKLAELKNIVPQQKQKEYIQSIIDNYEALNCLKPSEVVQQKSLFDAILPEVKLSESIGNKKFYELIVKAMRYEDLREADFLPYIQKSGIKSCVYCNAQLAIVTQRKPAGELIARLELDHHLPKSKYPFLCTSFFNLFPTCCNCNRLKSKNDLKFNLYTENPNEELNPFVFSIENKSVIQYLTDFNDENLKIYFDSKKDFNALAKDHNDRLCIEGIYDTQKDVAAELIRKSQIYTPQYKRDLAEKFKPLFPNETILNRIIIGNYDKVADIHKRPMSKFVQDIAKQLHLI